MVGGMTLLFLLIAMACPAYAALWSDESTGVLKQTNKDAGNPADETEQVETADGNNKAVTYYNMHTKNGDFYVNINGADGVNSRIHIKAVFDSTNEKKSQNVKLTIASDSVNNHGVRFINDPGKDKTGQSYTATTAKGSTTEPERAATDDNDKYITGKNSAGQTVYMERNFTVVKNIQFQYTKEAYTYATGTGNVTNGTSRMNDKTHDWTNTGDSTLNGANGVYHSAHKETFSLQVNMANMNVYKSPTTVIGEYTVSLKHPTVAVTYKGNGATSGSSKTQSFNYNETKGIYTVSGKKLGFKKPGYKPNPGKQWNTKANGKGTFFGYDGSKKYAATELVNFTDGEKFTQKKLKLYAQWIAGTPTEEPEEETVTVTYHSRYPDGTDIVVTDEVLKNSNYTVKTYEQCGFYPPAGYAVGTDWLNAAGSHSFSLGYTIEQITSDYDLYAYWKVAEAAYTVRHWKQKAEGNAAIHNSDNYDLAETETGKAQIGTDVTPPVKTYAGFVSPAVQTGTVTEDGKLVIDYFYERQFYNVTLHAGTGIETVLGGGAYRYGQSVTIDASLKTGYHWSHWSGSFDQDTKNYTFTMPMSNVELTANGEANKYTIHFDPNGGAGHIDDIIATYDTDITLPDIWKADGTAAYEKYTLDGVNVTGDVISGAIPRSMMAGYEEEEPEDAEDTETAGELEDSKKQDSQKDDTKDSAESMEKAIENGSSESTEETEESAKEDTTGSESMDESKENDNSDNAEEAEQAKAAENNVANAKEDKAADDTEELEDTKKAAEPVKKVYASVFMGWALEDGKDSFIPKWKAGDVVQNLVAEDGGEITLYAVWDDCPWIRAEDLYYTLDQAQSGFITEAEILSHATASDREDGSPIAPGTNPAASDPSLYTSFTVPDYQDSDFTNLQHDGSVTENLTVVDHIGSTYLKQITVHVVNTTPVNVKPEGKTRFISEGYFNQDHEHGGLEENSIWITDPEYKTALQNAFNNLKNDTPEDEFLIPHETILEMKQYIQDHGIGNSKEPGALTEFYNRFMAPNKVEK